MLSHALTVSHDATVGYWNGAPENDQPDLGHSLHDLEYLSPGLRHQVILAELLGWIRVDGVLGEATVHVGRKDIATIKTPPASVFAKQLEIVRNYADLRSDRQSEILVQKSDIISFYGAMAHLNGSRRKHTIELLALTQSLCVAVEMQVKHLCRAARPVDLDPRVQPMIQTPDHSAFPSGHATEAFALAEVMAALMSAAGADTRTLSKLAFRIAANRVAAGVHFPTDSAAGGVLGRQIGRAVVALASGTPLDRAKYEPGKIDLPQTADFTEEWFSEILSDPAHPGHPTVVGVGPALPRLIYFYQRAVGEWVPTITAADAVAAIASVEQAVADAEAAENTTNGGS